MGQKVLEKGSVLFENDRKTVGKCHFLIHIWSKDDHKIIMHKNANSNRELYPHCLWKSPNSAPAWKLTVFLAALELYTKPRLWLYEKTEMKAEALHFIATWVEYGFFSCMIAIWSDWKVSQGRTIVKPLVTMTEKLLNKYPIMIVRSK